MEFKDYYATLGVAKSATEKEIKQAFRKLARKFHPDVNPGDKAAESRFKEVNEAYEVLGDVEKRRKYDELGANWKQYEQAQRTGGGAGGPFEDLFRGSATGGGYHTVTGDDLRDLFGGQDPFSDFFRQFFGGGGDATEGRRASRVRRSPRGRRAADLEQQVELTLEEAFAGATRRLSVRHNGHAKTIDVRIPAGVRDGARVRIAGEGAPGAPSEPAGDLYLKVRIKAHSVFTRDGADLHARLPIPVTTAVLGGTVDVPSPGGKPLRLRIPALTQSGQRFRLRDQGMPAVGKPDERGALYVTVEPQLPRALTDQQRAHYEALAKLEPGSPSAS
ncbi:MAG: DnaJ C-terminal domain-containing protein [Vicinamibacterales bacterium]